MSANIFEYQNPLVYQLRGGTLEDPYVPVVDAPYKVVDQATLLDELPVRLNKVRIKDTSTNPVTQYSEITEGIPDILEYICDYNIGAIRFNPVAEGKTLAVSFSSRGIVLIPDTRIYTKIVNGSITQTLNTVVSAASNFVYIGIFNNSTIYSTYNIVSYQGSTYMFKAITSSAGHLPTDLTYWLKIAGNTNRGVYSTSTMYAAGDIVEKLDYKAIYQSLVDGNLNQPLTDTSKWQLLIDISNEINTINATNTSVTNAESARVTVEGARVTAETGRTSAESSRVSAESTRVNSESSRSTAETSRASAETGRSTAEAGRTSAEASRVSAESTRSSNESTRLSSESTRVSSESSRVSAETSRVSAESSRVGAESSRVSVEGNRVTAEMSRASAEATRSGNETTRQSQETTRQTNETGRISNNASFAYKGEYSASASYIVNNTVSYNGSTYVCILNSTGNLPTTAYFAPYAVKGADGAGTVAGITSANTDISISGTVTNPILTANTGIGANQLTKRDINGNLQNIGHVVTNVSVDTILTYAQSGIINVTTGATNKTITLPDATTTQVVFTVKKADNGIGQVVINTTSSQTIDGVASKKLISQYATITLVSSGGNWLVEVYNDYDAFRTDTTKPFALQVRTTDPVGAPAGNMWYRSDLG